MEAIQQRPAVAAVACMLLNIPTDGALISSGTYLNVVAFSAEMTGCWVASHILTAMRADGHSGSPRFIENLV